MHNLAPTNIAVYQNIQISSVIWEFPPHEWFSEIGPAAQPYCLILTFLNGSPIQNPQLYSQIMKSTSSIEQTLIQFEEVSLDNKHLNLQHYRFTNETMNNEYHNHICLVVSLKSEGGTPRFEKHAHTH